jgi:hypothetical protein
MDLQAMDEAWSQIADVTLAGDQRDPNTESWGSIENLKIVSVEGSLSISGSASGAGVLIVHGNLDVGGEAQWSGLIICLGDAKLHGGGLILGSLLIQGTLAGRSEVGEGARILFSGAMIRRLAALTGYEVSSWVDQ